MESLLTKFFPEKGLGNLKLVVGTLLAACVLRVLYVLLSGIGFVYYPLMLVLLIFPIYAGFQFLMPKMDPRDPEADRFVVLGGSVCALLLGFLCFGFMFLPSLVLAAGLIFWRAPDLLEVLPWMDGDDHQIKL